VNPIASPTTTVADDSDNTNSGNAGFTVNVKRCVALPEAFVAVTVNIFADFATDGLPDNVPVDVSKDMPSGAAGLSEKLRIGPPVEMASNPIATVPTPAISLDEVRVKAGFSVTSSTAIKGRASVTTGTTTIDAKIEKTNKGINFVNFTIDPKFLFVSYQIVFC
jgi:hypothetical protein